MIKFFSYNLRKIWSWNITITQFVLDQFYIKLNLKISKKKIYIFFKSTFIFLYKSLNKTTRDKTIPHSSSFFLIFFINEKKYQAIFITV